MCKNMLTAFVGTCAMCSMCVEHVEFVCRTCLVCVKIMYSVCENMCIKHVSEQEHVWRMWKSCEECV